MKRFVLGALMFSWGIIGVIIFTVLVALHPCNYNGIDGMKGALLGMGIRGPYIVFWLLSILGLLICIFDICSDKLKHLIVSQFSQNDDTSVNISSDK
ncbi:hypothetical protein SAMN02745136_05423 [Anaerocolumna jejuensis DSM 15929]|uniref:Uncharacterized protein n=1 Tax=Anaerocolumna jejuensis DSM 15929 TaxID=1121322 RepID=A0A1M7CHQ6_9FIRM|nr:hypothetical protein [Anaerocolumna jejuensis]SHL66798.1 hypothetical protein SAMN02745136_05423 [Anaerocolumna jejuensis DSM 15929]